MKHRKQHAMKRLIMCMLVSFLLPTAPTAALTIVDAGAPAVNCNFSATPPPECTVTVDDDTTAMIPLANADGSNFLQSRTLIGEAGSEAAGLFVYLYRIDLSEVVATEGLPCVDTFAIDFGPVVPLNYD